MYSIAREVTFSSAHSIRGHEGGCEKLHGHNYRLKVIIQASELNELGMVMDFHELKSSMKSVIQPFDHANLNQVPPFDRENPTAEKLAQHIFSELDRILKPTGVRVERVELHETDSSCAIYTGP